MNFIKKYYMKKQYMTILMKINFKFIMKRYNVSIIKHKTEKTYLNNFYPNHFIWIQIIKYWFTNKIKNSIIIKIKICSKIILSILKIIKIKDIIKQNCCYKIKNNKNWINFHINGIQVLMHVALIQIHRWTL